MPYMYQLSLYPEVPQFIRAIMTAAWLRGENHVLEGRAKDATWVRLNNQSTAQARDEDPFPHWC